MTPEQQRIADELNARQAKPPASTDDGALARDLRLIILQLIRTTSVRIAEEHNGIRAYITFGEAQRITDAIMELLAALRPSPRLEREGIVAAMESHFKSIIEAGRGLPFLETKVDLPTRSFEGYADAILAILSPDTEPNP